MNLFHDHDRMKFNLTQKNDIHELFLELNEHDVCLKGKSYHLQSNEKLENAPPCYSYNKEHCMDLYKSPDYGTSVCDHTVFAICREFILSLNCSRVEHFQAFH
jgi:hypothetical protein